jgi:thiol-disulfide isomerase/thioredoxin
LSLVVVNRPVIRFNILIIKPAPWKKRTMRRLYSHLLCIVTLLVCSSASADQEGRLFEPSEDPLADVQQALSRAEDNDRRALVVVGANWCHDSRALASRLHSPPLAELIEENYELVFVDVGFYQTGREVLQQFGVPHFYATPTVLIVDPSSRASVNDEDRHSWGNAYNIDMPTSVQYFEKWATSDALANSGAESAELQQLYAEIDQFEQQLAERVAAGYAVVGPMLKARVAGDSPEEFDASWDELSDFRMAIPNDIRQLRDEAQRRVSEGEEDIQLVFPEYALLSWESE